MKDEIQMTTEKPTQNKRRAVRIVQIVMALGLVLAVWIGWQAYASDTPRWNPYETGDHSQMVPKELGGLKLAGQLMGQDAIASISELHGKDVGVIDGYMARYRGGGADVMLWMGQAKSPADAADLLTGMTGGIARGNPNFSNLEKLNVDGVTVYTVTGGGERHFYYSREDKVIWLAVSGSDPMIFIRDALRVVK